MKVHLHDHYSGTYLMNEDYTAFARPYFITHPLRTTLLREKGLEKDQALFSVTEEELELLVNNSVIRWRELLPWMIDIQGELYGWAPKPIASATLHK